MTIDQFLAPAKRGPHYGHQSRYLLRLPEPFAEPKSKLRTRMTTFIKAMESGDALIPWAQVTALVGLSRNPALRAEWAALLARYPDPYYDGDEAKAKAKDIAERAKESGGGGTRRDTGTALHDIFAAVVTGAADVSQVDGEFRWHVEAMLAALDDAGFEPVPELSERSVYLARFDVVGSFDLVVRRRSDGALLIADVKTGGLMWTPKKDYKTGRQIGWYDAHEMSDLKEATQLAGYASADYIIEWPEDKFDPCGLTPMPPVDQSEGIVIHAPSTERGVALRRLDLSAGRAALELCAQIRDIRKSSPLLERIGDPAPLVQAGAVEGNAVKDTPQPPAPADEDDPFAGLPNTPASDDLFAGFTL